MFLKGGCWGRKEERKKKVNKRRRDAHEILRKLQPEGGEPQAKEVEAWGGRVLKKKKRQGAKSLGLLWEVNGAKGKSAND